MVHNARHNFRTKRVSQAVTVALASLMADTPARAQQAADEANTVLIVGTRASQQSAIDRKKNADTAQDSIIAEDVGSFPDRNVADAISRIAGVAVERGSYGEGTTVSIRGNGPELTRVELDGQGVQSAGGTDMFGGISAGSDGGGGRGVELRQLSSDLIKSVDVVKGSTADMTEGSLGGAVRIQTRTGLDFKKRYLSLRVAGQQNSLNRKVNPNLNLVAADKFLGGRLGVLVNVSHSKVNQEAHQINQGGTNSQQGATRPLDFDNSPEKTFSFQPGTVNLADPAATTPVNIASLIGGGSLASATPEEVVRKSAAAKSKAECYAAFPLLTTAQQNAITAGNTRTNAINARSNELLTCLGQWNDWVPSNTRYFRNRWDDERLGGDLRVDFKVNDKLTVYAKHSRNRSDVESFVSQMSYGGISGSFTTAPGNVAGPGGYVGPATSETLATQPNGAAGIRQAHPASGYYSYPDLSYRSGGALLGAVSNIDPASVVVDAKHRVTSFDLSDSSYGTNTNKMNMQTKSHYTQAGGSYRDRLWRAEFMLADARSEFYRYERSASFNTPSTLYNGPVKARIGANGRWNYSASPSFDVSDPDNFFVMQPSPAITSFVGSDTSPPRSAVASAQLPLLGNPVRMDFGNPRINESYEKSAKLDLTANTSMLLPFVSSIKAGGSRRKSGYQAWGAGGATLREPVGTYGQPGYQPGLYLPSNAIRTSFQACQDTAGSLGPGGLPCQYGYTQGLNSLGGNVLITPDQFRDVFRQVASVNSPVQYYRGDPERAPGMVNGWTELDIDKMHQLINAPNYNLDCIKFCTGSDGQVYAQPSNSIAEVVEGAYLMANFSVDRIPFTQRALPFGLEFDGNFGYRMISTRVIGTGQLTYESIAKTASYNELDPDAPGGISRRIYREDTAISARTRDYMPALNLNTWMIPNELVLRYNWAKTIARPPAGRLIAQGYCIYDERFVGELDADGSERDQRCTSTMGNPALRPQTNRNSNLSLEWYAGRDLMLAASVYRHKGIIGAPTLVENVTGAYVFAGSDIVDDQSGRPLADQQFNYRRYTNQLPRERTGFEVSGKMAFTFLPWYLRYTGLDANYTRNKSKNIGTVVVDPLTGDVMPVAFEPRYSWNASLWYDDGALTARVSLQAKTDEFQCISSCNSSVNNYPMFGINGVRNPVYNPGAPLYRIGGRYLDAKLGYRFKNGMELFVEGRNLGRIHTGTTSGPYARFADGTPNVLGDSYAGSTILAGVNFKLQ